MWFGNPNSTALSGDNLKASAVQTKFRSMNTAAVRAHQNYLVIDDPMGIRVGPATEHRVFRQDLYCESVNQSLLRFIIKNFTRKKNPVAADQNWRIGTQPIVRINRIVGRSNAGLAKPLPRMLFLKVCRRCANHSQHEHRNDPGLPR